MKRLLLLMMISFISMGLFADLADVQLGIGSHNVVVGNEISIPITSSNLTSLGVISYQIDLAFSPALISYSGYTKTGTISSNALISVNEVNGTLHIAGMAASALQGNGTLLYIKFQASQPGTSPLNLVTAMMNTTELLNLSDGSLFIDNQPVQVSIAAPDILIRRGDSRSFAITADGVANMNCLSFQFQLFFDPNVLSITGLNTTNCISAGWQITSRISGNKIEIAGMGTTALAQNGDLVNLNVVVADEANTHSALNLEQVLFNAIPALTIVDGRIDVYDLFGLAFTGVEDLTHILSTTLICEWQLLNTSSTQDEIQFQAGTDADWETAEIYSSPWSGAYVMHQLLDLQPGSDIYVRVRIRIGDTISDWIGLSGHLNMLPAPPALVSPSENQLWNQTQIQFVATEAIDTDGDEISYLFEITVNGNPESITSDSNTLAFTATDNSFISWRVRISDGYQTSDWSSSYTLMVNTHNQAPYVIDPDFVLSMDEDSTHQLNLNQHFDDADLAVGDSLRYSVTRSEHIAVSILQGIASITPDANWFGSESIIFRARDDSLAVAIDTLQVIVQNMPDPPSPATLQSPAMNVWNVAVLPLLSWNAGIGDLPTGYRLWLGTNNPPSNVINGQDLGLVTAWQISTPLQYNTSYYWKVEAYNTDGPALGTSIWQFRTIASNVINTYPYLKNFEDNVLLSGGWTNINQGSTSGNWRMNSTYGVNSSKAMSVGRSTGNYFMISPAFLCPAKGSVLSFSARDFSSSATYDIAGESLQILISTTGASVADFTHVVGSLANGAISTVHNVFTYDLHEFADQVVYIAFKRVALNGNYVYVDNITMRDASPVLSLATSSLVFPATALGQSSAATVSIVNSGTGILNGTVSYDDQVSGPAVFSGRNIPLEVEFNPSQAGFIQGTISISFQGDTVELPYTSNANYHVFVCDSVQENGFSYYPGSLAWNADNVNKHSGEAAITPVVNAAMICTPWLSVSANNTLGFWAKSASSDPISIYVNTGNQREVADYSLLYSQATSPDWQYYSVPLSTFQNQVISLALGMNPGTWIDDIDLGNYATPNKPLVNLDNENGQIQWQAVAHNTSYLVQFSTDMIQWETISTQDFNGTSWDIPMTESRGFYRVISVNGN